MGRRHDIRNRTIIRLAMLHTPKEITQILGCSLTLITAAIEGKRKGSRKYLDRSYRGKCSVSGCKNERGPRLRFLCTEHFEAGETETIHTDHVLLEDLDDNKRYGTQDHEYEDQNRRHENQDRV